MWLILQNVISFLLYAYRKRVILPITYIHYAYSISEENLRTVAPWWTQTVQCTTKYTVQSNSTQYSTQYRIGLCSVLRQHSIGYMGDGFYRSKDPTNSIKVLKEDLQKTKQTMKTTKYTYVQTIIKTQKDIHKISTTSPLVYTNMGWLGDSSHRGQGR